MAAIERVEIVLVDLKPKVKRTDAIQSFVSQETPIVAITDSDGVVGTGYSYTIGTGGSSVMRLLADHVAPRLIGKDAERIEALAATFDGPALATSSNKALQARLEQNTPDGPIQAPVVIAQGLSDVVAPPSVTDAYVEERCAAGQRLEYWTFAGRDHLTIFQAGTPLDELLMAWTTARFANEPKASGCVHKSF